MNTKRDSDVRRLLVVSYHFPPDGAIGGQRWAALSKYLARLGWEVHVITASAVSSQHTTPGVHRHVRRRRRTLDDLYKAAAGRVRQGSNGDQRQVPKNSGRSRSILLPAPLAAMRRILSGLMYLPDQGRGWVGRATGAARALLRKKKFDVVITSGPPHSAHFAGMLAALGRDVEFWIDMRDPWSVLHEMHKLDDRIVRAERFLLRRLERLIFSRAARVIVNTREFELALRADEPELEVVWFPNGVDLEQLPARDPNAVEKCSLCYIGTLYANRNLSSVLAAMCALLRDRPEAAAMLRLNVAGALDAPNQERMNEEIAAAGLSAQVSIHGLLPRAQALDLLSRSHLALVLAQDQPMCVPAKLYESVGLGVPTVVIAEEGSAAASEARRIGAVTLDGGDVDGLRTMMEDLLAGRVPTMIETRAPISYAELAVKMDRLLRQSDTR